MGPNPAHYMLRYKFCILALIFLCACSQPKEINPIHDTLTFAVPYDPDTLDPHSTDTISNIAISSHFYDALVMVDGSLDVHPALADTWLNPDSKTWVFHLRKNVKFHNGKSLTSDDVVYSFERVMKDPSLEMSVYARHITSIRKLSSDQIEIKTDRPTTILLNKIRMIAILPKGTTSADLQSSENGTGAYRLLSWEKGSIMKMVRNENYWGEKPFLREATFRLKKNPDQAIASFVSGESSFIQCNSKKLDQVSAVKLNAQHLRSDSLFVEYLGFNLSTEKNPSNPFSNLALRQAIHLALDRKKIASNLSIYAVPAAEPVPVFVFGYNPEIVLSQPNPARVQELLKQAKWSSNSSAVIHVRESFREAGALVQQQLKDAGISMQLEVLPDDQFFGLRKEGRVLAYVSRYACTTGDASDLVEDVFHSPDRAGLLDGVDPARYSHPATGEFTDDEEPTNLIDHRRKGLQAVMSMFMDDLLFAPLYEEQDAYMVNNSYSWKPRYDSVILASEVRPAK